MHMDHSTKMHREEISFEIIFFKKIIPHFPPYTEPCCVKILHYSFGICHFMVLNWFYAKRSTLV